MDNSFYFFIAIYMAMFINCTDCFGTARHKAQEVARDVVNSKVKPECRY